MRRLVVIATVSLASLGLGLGVAGCNGAADFAFGIDDPGPGGEGGGAVGPSASTCGGDAAPLEKLADPSTLPACAPACGGAHCVEADKVPEASRSFFAACGGGFCLPDTLIVSGGAKPPSCTSLGGQQGVCISLCVPDVLRSKDLLSQATCAADERCTPCLDPQSQKPTGACAIGTQISSGPCTGPTTAPDAGPAAPLACPYVGAPLFETKNLPECGGAGSGAHCLPGHLADPALVSKLATCTGGYCVPDKLIVTAGHFVAKTCASLLGAEGRCQNTVLPLVNAQQGLPVDSCDATERCVPCFSPIDGTETGACKVSCDPGPATTVAKTFASCCNKNGAPRGKCVPRTAIPPLLTSNLQGQGCANDTLCVPTENLEASYVPPACSASTLISGNYTGVCLSDCLDFGFGSDLALDRGNCASAHTCAPCRRDGKPTGAPGCPP